MHIESPYRPDEPVAPKPRKPRLQRADEAPAEPVAGGGQLLSRMRQAIGSRMVQSLQTAATCTTIAEADLVRIEAGAREDGVHVPAVASRARRSTRCASSPQLNATLESDGTLTTYDGRAPRHRGVARRGRADRPHDPGRAGASRRGPRQADEGPRARRARERAEPGRGARRHVHDHQPRRYGSIWPRR